MEPRSPKPPGGAAPLTASRRHTVKAASGLSARGRGRVAEAMTERQLEQPKPPGGKLTRREQRERPDHTTRTGFFAQREAGFQVGFVAPTGSSLPATAEKKPRELFRGAAMAVRSTNLLKPSLWNQGDDASLGLDDGADVSLDAQLARPCALENASADHQLLHNMSGTRFFAQTAGYADDDWDDGPQGEKEHHVRAAQALWSTNDGNPLNLQEFAEISDHNDKLAALHTTDAHSDSEEEMEAMDKQRNRARPKSVGRLSRVNMPEQLPVEVFLDEYPTEIIDYLRSRWGTKHLREKQRRKLRTIRMGLRRSLGPSKQLRRVMWSCGASAVILLAIVIYFGVLLYQLSEELWQLENPEPVPDPHNIVLQLSVKRHDIALTQAGTSRVCRCFAPSQLTDRQRLVGITPQLVSTSTREVVASIGVYITSCTTDDCLSGDNFDCADHYGGTDSKLLMRWNSLQHNNGAASSSMPDGVGLRVVPRVTRPSLDGTETNVGTHRLMLVVEYNLQRMPHLMQQAVWNARRPWSAVGVQVFMRDVRTLDHSADVLTLAAVGFTVPAAVPDTRIAFNVSLGARQSSGEVLDYSPWVSPEGYANGLTLFGGQYTTRELGRSVAVRLIRNESDVRNSVQVASDAFATRPVDYGQSLRVLSPAGGSGFPHLGSGDVVEVDCRFNSMTKLSPTGSAWVSEAGSADTESSRTLSEICVAQLYYYPDVALEFPHRTLLPGKCTTSEVLEEFVG
jgi:hypothetical protein